uniref:Ig-like domain-containing protein n=1 Tax=Pygocentrus nattereri TaxID=42514 RepID=A0A3B4CMU9_PYGNA
SLPSLLMSYFIYLTRISLNDVTISYYDSNMDSKMSCPDWINSPAGQECWEIMQLWTDNNREVFSLGSLADFNIYQASGCCSLSPDGTYKSSLTHSFNGKDFLSLDVERQMFVAAVPQAVVYKHLRDRDTVDLNEVITFYKTLCQTPLQVFSNCVPVPEVRIFEKQKAGSITVTCHVTGFYPRAVQVDWLDPDLQPVDEGVTDVLPNEDGTYQTRKSVTVPEEDVGKHTYSCVVLHSSVEHNITTVWGRMASYYFHVKNFLFVLQSNIYALNLPLFPVKNIAKK